MSKRKRGSITPGQERKGKRLKRNDFENPECVFCGTATDDEMSSGKKISACGVTAHNFCMLFSAGLHQRGRTDTEGLLGFLIKDISKEVKRGGKLKCIYCKHTGASIGCCIPRCKATFHFPCGKQNGALYQFFDKFSAFCPNHRLKQNVTDAAANNDSNDGMVECAICKSDVEARPCAESLLSSCCKNAWFHRDCIQKSALSAGLHHCKCPICSNKAEYQEEIQKFGIYIPDRDAGWELEQNAYGDLYEQYSMCDIEPCLCPRGNSYSKKNDADWEVVRCDNCGSQGCHIRCAELDSDDDWLCVECEKITNKLLQRKKVKRKHKDQSARQRRHQDQEQLAKKAQSHKCQQHFPTLHTAISDSSLSHTVTPKSVTTDVVASHSQPSTPLSPLGAPPLTEAAAPRTRSPSPLAAPTKALVSKSRSRSPTTPLGAAPRANVMTPRSRSGSPLLPAGAAVLTKTMTSTFRSTSPQSPLGAAAPVEAVTPRSKARSLMSPLGAAVLTEALTSPFRSRSPQAPLGAAAPPREALTLRTKSRLRSNEGHSDSSSQQQPERLASHQQGTSQAATQVRDGERSASRSTLPSAAQSPRATSLPTPSSSGQSSSVPQVYELSGDSDIEMLDDILTTTVVRMPLRCTCHLSKAKPVTGYINLADGSESSDGIEISSDSDDTGLEVPIERVARRFITPRSVDKRRAGQQSKSNDQP